MSFNAKLTTKLEKFSVDDSVVELKNSIETDELNNIVRSLLRSLNKVDDQTNVDNLIFDFLVGGRILRLSVEKHLELYSDELNAKEILNEKLVEVEYIPQLDPPKPLDQFQQDDWVSSIDVNGSHIVSGSYDNSIRIYSIRDRKNVVIIKDAHEKPISKVRWVAGPKETKESKNELYFVSCGHDEVTILRRFNTKTMKVEILTVFNGHSRSVNCVDSDDNLIATGSFDKTLRLWSTSLTEDEEVDDQIDEIENNSNGSSRNKKRKIKSTDKAVSKSTKSAIMTLTGHQESVTGVKWLHSCNDYNSVASSSMDKTICIWDIEVGECKRRLLSSKPILGIDYCGERNLIISASCDRHLRLWDSRASDNATAKAAYTSHNAWVSCVAFGGKDTDHFISGGYDNLVKLWDLRSPKACLYDLIGHHDKVLDINFNIDYVSSCSADSTIKTFKF